MTLMVTRSRKKLSKEISKKEISRKKLTMKMLSNPTLKPNPTIYIWTKASPIINTSNLVCPKDLVSLSAFSKLVSKRNVFVLLHFRFIS